MFDVRCSFGVSCARPLNASHAGLHKTPDHGTLRGSIPNGYNTMVPAITKQNGDQCGPLLEQFQQADVHALQPAWLRPLRKAGRDSFADQGFPTLHDEDWRFTNLAALTKLSLRPGARPADGQADTNLDGLAFAQLEGPRLVFINGHYSARLSSIRALPPGVIVGSLAAALAGDAALLEKHLGQYAQLTGNAFAALNQAFFTDGAFIHVPAGVEVKTPIQLIFVASGAQAGDTFHPRNLIIAGDRSKLTVLETYIGSAESAYVTNAVTELVAGDHAVVELIKFQDEGVGAFHLATLQGRFGRGSNARVHSFALGARLSRNNIRANLAGEGLECILNGLYLTKGEQLADHHMIVEHAQPNCASHEYFNGILDDHSRGVFHGRILVRPLAQKTDAKQTNKNLLLSDDAVADTKPQLEIYADDVKCTHGATIGQLNDESIFYMRSRGLSTEAARHMLIHAFAGEIIDRVQFEPAREALDQMVWDRLEAHPHLAETK